jgi:hypothetical protein
MLRQALQNGDGLGHGLDRDPVLRLTANIASFVDGASDLVALDEPVLAAPDI